jgi:hypothetical protein
MLPCALGFFFRNTTSSIANLLAAFGPEVHTRVAHSFICIHFIYLSTCARRFRDAVDHFR